jgi:hypothetical protein
MLQLLRQERELTTHDNTSTNNDNNANNGKYECNLLIVQIEFI